MEEKLTKLYNTMMLIETKGEGTKLMAQCLNYVQMLANEASQAAIKTEAPIAEVGEE